MGRASRESQTREGLQSQKPVECPVTRCTIARELMQGSLRKLLNGNEAPDGGDFWVMRGPQKPSEN